MTEVEIWSDIMCPWCYIGKKRLERALAGCDDIRVTWRSFELRPSQPAIPGATLAEMMAQRFDLHGPDLAAVFQRIRQLGTVEGLDLNPATARPVNSFDAHRLIHLAADHDLADSVVERLFQAHLADNINVADPAILRPLAARAGLPDAAVRSVLDTDAYAADVRADEERAIQLGVRQVPTFVINGAPAIAGAPDVTELRTLLTSKTSR
ncbi:DsbA family oxidoreductase [Nonomuraea sp. NPDC049637]|uniref:DsbA family oxidoreductase n=1 Tax=Nonomuraea sp. NPDC049637 TaxID=3154356 RepID=UPI003421CABA